MIVTCPECSKRYSLDAKTLGQSGRQVRCASCGHEWLAQAQIELDTPVKNTGQAQAAEANKAEEVTPQQPDPDSSEALPQAVPEPDPAPKPPHRAWREQREAKARRRRRLMVIAAWSGVAASLALGFTLVILNRVAVVRAIPRTASAFNAIGLPTNRWGIDLKVLKKTRTRENGVPVLHISGELFNPGKKALLAPQVRISLRDEMGTEIHAWIVPVKTPEIPPKSGSAFTASIKNVPPQAVSISYSLVEKVDTAPKELAKGTDSSPH